MRQSTCSWCGLALERGSPRMRMHATPDSSVRNTRTIANFHPACGQAVLDQVNSHRELAATLDEARPVWKANPRHRRAA